ncbi:MAG: hypothetical protein IPO29_09370 [Anaerolineae bacterium]|nr:hypothetical protein [Anaerolineae bacterium]
MRDSPLQTRGRKPMEMRYVVTDRLLAKRKPPIGLDPGAGFYPGFGAGHGRHPATAGRA